MRAEVAINVLLLRLNAAMVNPLMAPPVPSNPAEKPDRAPPSTAFLVFGWTTIWLLIIKSKLNPTRKQPRTISRKFVSSILERNPPIITNNTDGKPMVNNSRLSRPSRKRKILLRLLDK